MSNVKKTKTYFDSNPKHFQDAIQEYPLMYQQAATRISPYLHGRVVDVGSGGILNYDLSKIDALFLVDITTANKERARKNTFFIHGNVCTLCIGSATVDVVIMQHLLHHLADDSLSKTLAHLHAAFSEAYRILKSGGVILIVEGTVPYSLDLLQRFLFPLNKRLYKLLFHFPMVLQYAKKTIFQSLHSVGFSVQKTEIVPDGDILPIFGMNLPRKYIPLRHHFIVAEKK